MVLVIMSTSVMKSSKPTIQFLSLLLSDADLQGLKLPHSEAMCITLRIMDTELVLVDMGIGKCSILWYLYFDEDLSNM